MSLSSPREWESHNALTRINRCRLRRLRSWANCEKAIASSASGETARQAFRWLCVHYFSDLTRSADLDMFVSSVSMWSLVAILWVTCCSAFKPNDFYHMETQMKEATG